MREGDAVNRMFAGISGRYDVANHLLSGGIDYYWRKKLIDKVKLYRPQRVVDLATGSGDVAFKLYHHLDNSSKIEAMDFCEPMLEIARRKKAARKIGSNLLFTFGDCMCLPLEDESVDAVTISFGVRNFEDRQRGLREINRILTPGGKLFILEFSQPVAWFRPIYYAYLKYILPTVAALATGKKDAYNYLAGTIESFPTQSGLTSKILQSGFKHVESSGHTFSIVAIHIATK